MKLEPASLEPDALATLGAEAVEMLCRGDVKSLARQFGYALAYGRDLPTAIREDLEHCLSTVGGTSLGPSPVNAVPTVKYFRRPQDPVCAVVECVAPSDNGASLLVELVVTRKGTENHITLEQISAITEVADSD